MRDPASRFDPQSDIEDTCQFLEKRMQSEFWKADPDGFASDMHATIDVVEASDLPDWAKKFAILALLEQTKKRRGKPTRKIRDHAIRLAAIRLVCRGYRPTRNDVTFDRESACSIIHRALQRLGETPSEKSINAIVAKVSADDRVKRKAPPAFVEWVREHAPDFVDMFESDPNAPDIVDLSGRPVVLK